MYSIHITYTNIEGEEKVSIYYPISGIAIDGNMVRLYGKDGVDKQHNYHKITKIVLENYQ